MANESDRRLTVALGAAILGFGCLLYGMIGLHV